MESQGRSWIYYIYLSLIKTSTEINQFNILQNLEQTLVVGEDGKYPTKNRGRKDWNVRYGAVRPPLTKRPLLCYTVTHKVIFKLSIAMIFGCHFETCLTIYQMVLKNLTAGNQKYIKTFLFSFRSPSSSSRVSSSS